MVDVSVPTDRRVAIRPRMRCIQRGKVRSQFDEQSKDLLHRRGNCIGLGEVVVGKGSQEEVLWEDLQQRTRTPKVLSSPFRTLAIRAPRASLVSVAKRLTYC